MCQYCDHIILSQTDHAQLSWCKGCRSFSLVYRNCALSFTPKELKQFKRMLEELSEEDYNYDFFGQQMVLIKNQYAYMGVCFTECEVDILLDLISEALAMKEVFGIIYK
ncbi:MAG: DUF6686 family protein [Bacteroidota bacterium]